MASKEAFGNFLADLTAKFVADRGPKKEERLDLRCWDGYYSATTTAGHAAAGQGQHVIGDPRECVADHLEALSTRRWLQGSHGAVARSYTEGEKSPNSIDEELENGDDKSSDGEQEEEQGGGPGEDHRRAARQLRKDRRGERFLSAVREVAKEITRRRTEGSPVPGRVEEFLLRLATGTLITLVHLEGLLKGGNAVAKAEEYRNNPRSKGCMRALTRGAARDGASGEEAASTGPGRPSRPGAPDVDEETVTEEEDERDGENSEEEHGNMEQEERARSRELQNSLRKSCPLCARRERPNADVRALEFDDTQEHFVWCTAMEEKWKETVRASVQRAMRVSGVLHLTNNVSRTERVVTSVCERLPDRNAHYTRRCGLFKGRTINRSVYSAMANLEQLSVGSKRRLCKNFKGYSLCAQEQRGGGLAPLDSRRV